MSDMETEGKMSHRASNSLSPCQSGRKKDKMTNIFLTDSYKEAIVQFIKDHKELYDTTHKLFKNKARHHKLHRSARHGLNPNGVDIRNRCSPSQVRSRRTSPTNITGYISNSTF